MSQRLLTTLALLAAIAGLVAGCGSSGQDGGQASSSSSRRNVATLDQGSVAAETAEGWAAEWCSVATTMTRSQVRKVMGPPTSTFGGDVSQDKWVAYQWHFTAFYAHRTDQPDPMAEKVSQLDANDVEWSATDRAKVPCDLTRFADD